MLLLGTADNKPLTSLQDRARNDANYDKQDGYFKLKNMLKVEKHPTTRNAVILKSGIGLIGNVLVEEESTSTLTITEDGDFKIYIEVNLKNTPATTSFNFTKGTLQQDDLLNNPKGIYQGLVANVNITSGDIKKVSNTLYQIYTKETVTLDELNLTNDSFTVSGSPTSNMLGAFKTIHSTLYANWRYEVGDVRMSDNTKIFDIIKSYMYDIYQITLNNDISFNYSYYARKGGVRVGRIEITDRNNAYSLNSIYEGGQFKINNLNHGRGARNIKIWEGAIYLKEGQSITGLPKFNGESESLILEFTDYDPPTNKPKYVQTLNYQLFNNTGSFETNAIPVISTIGSTGNIYFSAKQFNLDVDQQSNSMVLRGLTPSKTQNLNDVVLSRIYFRTNDYSFKSNLVSKKLEAPSTEKIDIQKNWKRNNKEV